MLVDKFKVNPNKTRKIKGTKAIMLSRIW